MSKGVRMGGEKVLLQILLFSIPCIFLFIKILSRGSISVEFEGEKARADSVTINCYENVGDSIVVGLKINNGKITSAVRTELSITSRNLAWLTFLFWAIVLCLKQPKNK